MDNEETEIRVMLNEIRKTFNKMNILKETFTFPTDTHEKPSETLEVGDDLRPEMKPERNIESTDPIKDKINIIRKSAISIMGEIDPSEKAADYKSVRAILDACDKLIEPKTEKQEIK